MFFTLLRMKLHFQSYPLKLKHEFRLSYGSRTGTDSVQITLEDGGNTGYGEAVLPPYFGLTANDVLAELQNFDASILSINEWKESLKAIESSDLSSPTKAGLDMALHDLVGKVSGQPVYQMIGTVPAQMPATTYTIGQCDEAELKEKLLEAKDFHLIKLKLGGKDDWALVKQFRKHCSKPFMADPNQGWKDVNEALELIDFLKNEGCILLEQPMPANQPQGDQHRLKSESSLPLFADESVRSIEDLDSAAQSFHGVNVKLMKCGGIAPAHLLMKKASQLGLRLMIGCMAETSIGVMAAAHLAPLTEICDLDGPFLQANNPFPDPAMENGKICLTDRPGIGGGTRQF